MCSRTIFPNIEDLLAKLARGKTFTKLDMSQVHMEIRIEEKLEKYIGPKWLTIMQQKLHNCTSRVYYYTSPHQLPYRVNHQEVKVLEDTVLSELFPVGIRRVSI